MIETIDEVTAQGSEATSAHRPCARSQTECGHLIAVDDELRPGVDRTFMSMMRRKEKGAALEGLGLDTLGQVPTGGHGVGGGSNDDFHRESCCRLAAPAAWWQKSGSPEPGRACPAPRAALRIRCASRCFPRREHHAAEAIGAERGANRRRKQQDLKGEFACFRRAHEGACSVALPRTRLFWSADALAEALMMPKMTL